MKILSVIIPTYNMEKYLSRCLDSMLEVNNKTESLEIIIVNDGSKDSSLAIAKEYERVFSGIVKVIDKNNGNYGSCVNRGIKEASGKYFRILDADDTFKIGALDKLLEYLSISDEDMIVTQFSFLYDLTEKRELIKANNVVYGKIYKEFDFSKGGNDNILSMHGITYKTTLLHDIALTLDEGVSYTDLEYVYFPLKSVASIKFLDIELYEYHIGREGQTVDPRSQVKSIGSFLTVTKRLVNDYCCNFKSTSEILMNNERITINKIIYTTFKVALVHCSKNKCYDTVLKDIYTKIKQTDNSVLWLKKQKIRPIVVLWDLTGIYYSKLKSFFKL